MNISYCKVYDCRYKTTHTTKGHKCGKCKKFGHGIVECGKNNNINNLLRYFNDIITEDLQCTYENCMTKDTHTNEGHHCDNCGDRLHSLNDCIKEKIIKCPICRIENIIKYNQKKITGLEEKCSICFDNNIEIYFPNCGHTCICFNCLQKL